MSDAAGKIRLDKWLWQARFFKTRSLSAKVISGGHVRVNAVRVAKPAFGVAVGDVLTFSQARDIRVIKVMALGERRGPAPEAATLYEDLDPPQRMSRDPVPEAPKFEGKGRPTKRDRRKLGPNMRRELE